LETSSQTVCWYEEGCEDPWTFWNPKGALKQRSVGNNVLDNDNLHKQLFKWRLSWLMLETYCKWCWLTCWGKWRGYLCVCVFGGMCSCELAIRGFVNCKQEHWLLILWMLWSVFLAFTLQCSLLGLVTIFCRMYWTSLIISLYDFCSYRIWHKCKGLLYNDWKVTAILLRY